MNLKICGTSKYSILEVSRVLQDLGWTHIIYSAPFAKNKRLQVKVGDGRTCVFIANTLRSIKERKGVIIVVDSPSALAQTNIPQIPNDRDLKVALGGLPDLWRTDVTNVKPTVMELVDQAVTPSLMTDIQTALYKVSNHPLRKEAQASVIKYLNSKMSLRALLKQLNCSYTLDTLRELVQREEAKVLINAVAQYRSGVPMKEIEASTGCSSFDILYLTHSFDKTESSRKEP